MRGQKSWLINMITFGAIAVMAQDSQLSQPAIDRGEKKMIIEKAAALPTGISVNEDSSNFYGSFPDSKMTREGLEIFIANYTTGQVKEVFLNPNAMRCSYATRVPGWEAIWDGCDIDNAGNVSFRGLAVKGHRAIWAKNAKKLADQGINPYQVWLNQVRRSGRQGWISLRMNDIHNFDGENDILHNSFWRNHPQFRLTPGTICGLDYAHPEVREHMLALVDEYLELFDMDGLELDWTRFPWSLRDGYELLGAEAMNDFMRKVRVRTDQAAKRRGHPIKIAVRIPSRPDDARRLGYDFATWVDEKLVDMVTPTNFWPTTDSDMPLEIWRRLLGKDIVLGAGLELWTEINPGGDLYVNTPEMVYGFAAQYFYRGADRIYLFNHMVSPLTGIKDQARMPELLNIAGAPATVNSAVRRHVLTHCTPRPKGIADDAALPITTDRAASFRLNVGGGTAGREALIIIGLQPHQADPEQTMVSLNQAACPQPAEIPAIVDLTPTVKRRNESRITIARKIPAGALHDGDNYIEIDNRTGKPQTINWVEICLP